MKTNTYKRVLSLVLALALAFVLAACGSSGTASQTSAASESETTNETADETASETEAEDDGYIDDYVLKIGETQGALCHAPLQVAMELGYFDEEGIRWERVDFGSTDIQAALGAGTIDAGFGLVGKFIQPIENGLNMVITSGMHTGCTKILVRADSGITSIEDLRGKTIGVSSLAGSEAVTAKRALYAAGIDISADSDEVSFVVYSNTDQPLALQNGAVDAIATPDPVATTAEAEYGFVAILDTASTEPYASEYCCISFVSSEVAEEHPEVAAAFTRAVLRGSAWVAEHIDETAQLQVEKEYVTGDPEFNAEVLRSYNFVPSVQGGYDALVNVSQVLQEIGVLKATTDIDALVERSFRFFDDVPDTYTLDGDTFTAVYS
ncbi:MAG: ABC transporter substrate-binding protein [Oscillospiraceae bacterium]|nr:ABC transporter substrate-binding protein [Oscillospiraceae bacterium]